MIIFIIRLLTVNAGSLAEGADGDLAEDGVAEPPHLHLPAHLLVHVLVDFPQRLQTLVLRHERLLPQLPQLLPQLVDFLRVGAHHLFDLGGVGRVEGRQGFVLLAQLGHQLGLLLQLLGQLGPFKFKVVMGIVEYVDHLLDLVLVALDVEEGLVNMRLFPAQQFFALLLLSLNGRLQQPDLLLVAAVQLLNRHLQLRLVRLQLLHPRLQPAHAHPCPSLPLVLPLVVVLHSN